jgi:D-aspartate ligase
VTGLPRAIVLQPANGGLAVARALGRYGIDVAVLATPSDPHTANTRLARGGVLPSFDPDLWLENLAQLAQDGPAVVLAGGDEASAFLSRQRDTLPNELTIFESQDEVHLDLMDKTRAHELAVAAGVRVPWTQRVRGHDDLDRAVAAASFPNVVKPALSHLWRPLFGHDRVLLAHTAEELRVNAESALDAGLEIIVSEYVPGGDDDVEEAILVRAADGSFPLQFGCRKLRQSPRGFGAASLCESAPLHESLTMARTVLAHAGYVGVAGVETKRHGVTGERYLIEVNVRIPTQFGLGDASGVDASWRVYATLAGLPLAPQPEQRDGVRLLFPELDWQELRRYARGERGGDRPQSWTGWARSYAGARELGVLDLRDPGPALALVRMSAERRLGGLRSALGRGG